MGLVGAWTADRGIVLNGTNVQAWIDQTGNGYNLTQFTTANQPTYVASVTTNGFPAVIFSGSPRIMTSNRLGQLLNLGTTNCTIIQLICTQGLGLSEYSASLGYTGATNVAFSQIALIPNNSTSNTRIRFGSDNANVTLSSSLSITTNVYKYLGTTVDGVNGKIFHNLTGNANATVAYPRTVDTFAVGGMIGSNAIAL
jgi:hypothetical protein